MWRSILGLLLGTILVLQSPASAQQSAGSVRGSVRDRDFEVAIAGVAVRLLETGQQTVSDAQGGFLLPEVRPGTYTVVFEKDGYQQKLVGSVVVAAGSTAEVDAEMEGDFVEMAEFVVQGALKLAAAAEASLLALRFEAPALMDSVSSELMSQAGAGDAAAALRLVSGATVKDGKSAVIRGLPDRYVSSQLNGTRLPSADADKRAVELDQFPSAVIDDIRVSKTFTPDQQGDASGGAVDVRLKGLPDNGFYLKMKGQSGFNTNVAAADPFLSYEGGGVDSKGRVGGSRLPQFPDSAPPMDWSGAVGVLGVDQPPIYKGQLSFGGAWEFENGLRIGGSASVFQERDAEHYTGQEDEWWVESAGAGMTPQQNQIQGADDFKTSLFDVTRSEQSVQWGGLFTFGLETEDHKLGISRLYTRTATDAATLAEDTRGKAYYFPGYDPYDPQGPGNAPNQLDIAPYLRLQTLEYTERTTRATQVFGEHRLGFDDLKLGRNLRLHDPSLSWTFARSGADFYQPDKRQFGTLWKPASYSPGVPPFTPPSVSEPFYTAYKPGANFTLGNLQRIWREIEEESEQLALDFQWQLTNWNRQEGYLKAGVFADSVDRSFDQDSYSNFNDPIITSPGGWNDPWSVNFPNEPHAISASDADVDYDGTQDIRAGYLMMDLPVFQRVSLVGGARYERTGITVVNDAEQDAFWFPADNNTGAPVALTPGAADVDYARSDLLPSLALVAAPLEDVTFRASWSRTIARQTFKELTPIIQQEYLGGPIFIGNPELGMSDLVNWDLRVDWAPYSGSLLSASWFRKEIDDPIEYVQKLVGFTYTTAENYPEGTIDGIELEARQALGNFWDAARGFSVGANATFIDSRVALPDDEQAVFQGLGTPMTERDMTSAPESLLNLYLTWEQEEIGTRVGLFYTVQGDTLVAGAGESGGNFVPSLYALPARSLNLNVTQDIGKWVKLQFQAKNLTDPLVRTVYRSEYIGDDVIHQSYRKGVDFSVALIAEIDF